MDIKEKIELVETRFRFHMIIRVLHKYLLLDDGRKISKKDMRTNYKLYDVIEQRISWEDEYLDIWDVVIE